MLDLNYYLPCRVAQGKQWNQPNRTIAVIGLGRTVGGDFLSSEDVELLESLASYIGIALQNASLYARLEEKIGEFERLKEFNENIVESINVGILASIWTTASRAGMRRWRRCMRSAAPRPSARHFVPSFLWSLSKPSNSFRSEQGVHHLYKFRLITRAGEQRTANIAIAPLLSRRFCLGGTHHSGGRHHGARHAGNATGAGRQAQLHRLAGRRRGA